MDSESLLAVPLFVLAMDSEMVPQMLELVPESVTP